VSFLPYGDSRRPRRRSLDREQVVRAALALLDEAGLEQLTMRRLAERLQIQAASLYRHVHDKEELLVLLADELTAEIPLVEPTGTWQEQLTAMAHNVRRGLLAHRDGARLLAATRPAGPRRLRHIEQVLRALRLSGLDDRDVARTAYLLNNFVTEFAADEARYAAAAATIGVSRRKMFAAVRKQFQDLPPDQFPSLVSLAGPLTEDDPDALFQTGIEVLLRGIEARVRRRR
jgi:AcrR family transcriptional regulator